MEWLSSVTSGLLEEFPQRSLIRTGELDRELLMSFFRQGFELFGNDQVRGSWGQSWLSLSP